MSIGLEFLVQLGKLCRQELSKRGIQEKDIKTEDPLPVHPSYLSSHYDGSNRSANRRELRTCQQKKCDNSEGVVDVPEKALHEITTGDNSEGVVDVPEKALHEISTDKKDPETSRLKSREYQCTKCSYTSTYHPEYIAHVKFCTKKLDTGCPLCSETVKESELENHFTSIHVTPDKFKILDNGLYYCIKCDKSWKYFSHFKRHLWTLIHKSMDRCYNCEILLSSEEMIIHQKEVHGKVGNKYVCKICGLQYSSKMTFDRHRYVAHEVKKEFNCPLCGAIFSRRDNMRKHLRTRHSKERFSCSYCEVTFKEICNLRAHIKNIHLTKTKFKCKVCYRVFDNEEKCDIHTSMCHEEHQKFSCQICGQTFHFYSKRERHLQAHLNAFKKGKDLKVKPKSNLKSEQNLSAEEDGALEPTEKASVAQTCQNQIVESADLRIKSKKSMEERQAAASSNRKRKRGVRENCENRSPNLSGAKRCRSGKKKSSDTSLLKADRNCDSSSSKSYLSFKNPNLVTCMSGGKEWINDDKTKPTSGSTTNASILVQKSCIKVESSSVQSDGMGCDEAVDVSAGESEYTNFCKSPDDSVSECIDGKTEAGDLLYPAQPCLTVPENTLFICLNNPSVNDNTVVSFSLLSPDSSIAENTLLINLEHLPQSESIGLKDLTAADVCPVEVRYFKTEVDTLSANVGNVNVNETDSGVSCNDASLDILPLKKTLIMKEPTDSIPKQNSKLYFDLDKQVIVTNLTTNHDNFRLPKFELVEDDD